MITVLNNVIYTEWHQIMIALCIANNVDFIKMLCHFANTSFFWTFRLFYNRCFDPSKNVHSKCICVLVILFVHRFLHFIQLHLLIGQVFLLCGFLHTIFFPLIFTVSLKGLNMSPSTVASPSNKDTVIVPSYPDTRRYGLEILAHLLSDPYRPPSPTIKLLLGKSTLSWIHTCVKFLFMYSF